MPSLALDALPSEVVQNVLRFALPEATISFAQTSRLFLAAAYEPQLWKFYCATQYKFWDDRHRWPARVSGDESTDWRLLFGERRTADKSVCREFESILNSQAGRTRRFSNIGAHGYDAKETLLAHLYADKSFPDYLARRYWSRAVLDHMHRRLAIQEWMALRRDTTIDYRLERSMNAFDLFIIEDRDFDQADVLQRLENLCEKLLEEQPGLYDIPLKKRATKVAAFLKDQNYVGIRSGREYHNIEHNFLGIALSGDEHNSLPLVSVVIYCHLAKKLGLTARPCCFPFHVHAIVQPPEGFDWEGRELGSSDAPAPMFIDPFDSAVEIRPERLQSELNFILGANTPRESFLTASSDVEVITRCARNIPNSLEQCHQAPLTPIDTERAQYAALWALGLLSQPPVPGAAGLPVQSRHHLRLLMRCFIEDFSHDVSLIQDYLLPTCRTHPDYDRFRELAEEVYETDAAPREIKSRSSPRGGGVRYQIGHVFRHRRYGYKAVIVGWDTRCEMNEEWIQLMHVDQLSGGRGQCFYNAFVNDMSSRYVAEENIEIIMPDEIEVEFSPEFMFAAGQYFKRWDPKNSRFISNLKDEYPDD
ncbi:MAG: hypothetical protein Q9227_001927 [Pyrenula ochraceoflavens]